LGVERWTEEDTKSEKGSQNNVVGEKREKKTKSAEYHPRSQKIRQEKTWKGHVRF